MPQSMSDGRPGRSAGRAAIRAAAAFAAVGILWILASDTLLDVLTPEDTEAWAQTAKGVFFILAASGFVFVRRSPVREAVGARRVQRDALRGGAAPIRVALPLAGRAGARASCG